MNISQLTVQFLLVATISVGHCHIGGNHVQLQDVDPAIYCGRRLARTLAELCYDEPQKRSEIGTMYNSILSPNYKNHVPVQLGWPWMSPHKARALGLPARGKRFFIISECCEKPCTIEELLSYC